MIDQQSAEQRPRLRTAFQWLSVLMFALMATQPVLGGFGWYRDRGLFDIHEIVANTIFLVGMLLVVLAFLAGFRRKMLLAALSIVLLVMVTAQIGLGYSAEGRPTVGALHIPLGVFSFGVSLVLMLFAYGFTARRESV